MSNWQPTMELRFVERINITNKGINTGTVKILQQKWELHGTVNDFGDKGIIEEEWRDIPVEKEDANK